MMISHLLRGRNARSPSGALLRLAACWAMALLAPGVGPAPYSGAPPPAEDGGARNPAAGAAAPGSSALTRDTAGAAHAVGPCDSTSLELSAPLGDVLGSSKLRLQWRSADAGPFQVAVLDEKGRSVYAADTYGHELRVLVSGDGEAPSGGDESQVRNGRTYRWRVVPKFAPDPASCPTAEFRLLAPDESRAKQAGFAAEAERLGVGDESREPDASIALARLYLEQGFYSDAEALLQRLRQRAYDDERIEGLLADLYRRTGRRLSLAALVTDPEEPRAF